MKKLLMMTVLLAFGTMLVAQTPDPVKEKFKSTHPEATNPYWKAEKDNMYRVNYTDNNVRHAIVYDKEGNVVSEEMEVQATAVPDNINEYYKKRGADGTTKTYSVWQVKDKDGNVMYYSEYEGKTAYFDKEGNVTTRQGMATGDDTQPVDEKTPNKDKY